MKRVPICATLILGTSLTSVVAAADSSTPPDCVPDVAVSVGMPQTFATHTQLASYGFIFGVSDGNFGAIPAGDGTYNFFGTGAAASQCSVTKSCEGAFKFSGTLDAVTGADTTTALFGPGAGPGWVFDRDYAGGGQTIYFNDGKGHHGRFMSFHGEYQWQNLSNPPSYLCFVGKTTSQVPCFYSGLGLAVSLDDGKTFNVVGQTMQPTQPLSTFVGSGTNMPVGYGSMVIADRRGRHVENPPLTPKEAYFYLMFSDQLPAGTPGVGACAGAGVNCMGMARAHYLDLINAALSGDPDKVAKAFHKYDPGSPHAWSQPATSDTADLSGAAGSFAPLWTDEGANQGSIIYDRKLDIFLAAYQFGAIHIRASKNLIDWTGTLAVIPNPTSPAATYYYPTLVGETVHPNVAAGSPRLYFTSFPNTNHALLNSLLVERSKAMPIRRSPNGAHHPAHRLVAIARYAHIGASHSENTVANQIGAHQYSSPGRPRSATGRFCCKSRLLLTDGRAFGWERSALICRPQHSLRNSHATLYEGPLRVVAGRPARRAVAGSER